MASIWPGHKLETEKRVRVGGNPEDSRGNLLRAIFRVNFCGVFDFPTKGCFNPFGTIGLTTAIFFLLDSPVLVALFYMGQPP